MKNIKENKAITLIALVITIIVLLLLAGVSISIISGQDGILNKVAEAKNKTDQANKNDESLLESLEGMLDKEKLSRYNEQENVNKPMLSAGMIPVKFDGTNWVICDENDTEWYDYTNKEWANIILSDGKYKEGIAKVGTVVSNADLGSMFVWIPRYAYSIIDYKPETTLDGEGIEQKITEVKFLVGATNKDSTGNVYSTDYSTDEMEQKVANRQSGEKIATPMIVHPAFNFGGNNITGIWAAKFEASMLEENANTIEKNDVTNKTVKVLPNKESWRYIKIGNCFTNCLNMNAEGNIYGLTKATGTHLTKNVEWGAMVYLAVSQYGITPMINNAGKQDDILEEETEEGKLHIYTGGGEAPEAYKTNVLQSTTGNVTGIYDLNGGSWGYIAAYYDNEISTLSLYGTNTYFENNKLKKEYEKYWDRYDVSEEEVELSSSLWSLDATYNSIRKRITEVRYNLMKNVKGDAMYEVIKNYSYYGKKSDGTYIWMIDEQSEVAQYGRSYYNSDFILMGNTYGAFLIRDGAYWNYENSGMFSVGGDINGSARNAFGFRPMLIVQ